MEITREFGKLGKHDAAIAGGKGASLGEMTQAGIPVPPGFVVLTSAFDKFLEDTDLGAEIDSILDQVNHKEIHTVEHASQKIQALIIGAKMPKDIKVEILNSFKNLGAEYVAVRSSASAEDSASAAWAGQLDSYLNTTENDLLEKVQKCWASLFTPRAIFYRFEKGMHGLRISVAVVVQKMVNSERSGIAFSVHPVTEDYNQLIIEAGFGLGEAIVSGQITPDSYVVEKEPRRIIDVNVNVQNRALHRKTGGGNTWVDLSEAEGSKQVLSQKEVFEFSEIILNIEKHYGFPCDIEWAHEKGKFYIVQSRPITTLKPKTEEKQAGISIDDWKLVITRNMSLWHQYLSSIGHFLNTKDFGVKAQNQQLSFTLNGTQTSLFTRPENMKEYSAAILEAVNSDAKIKALKNKYKKFAKELLDSLKKCDKNLNVKTWNDFVKNYTRFCAGLFLTSVIGRAGLDKLMQKLKEKGYKDEEIPEMVSNITYPVEHTPLFDSQLGLLEIGALVQKKKVNQKIIKTHLEKWLRNYGFIPVNFCEEPWTIKDAESQLKDFLKKDCVKELANSKKSHKDRVLNAKKTLKEIKGKEISVLAKALAEGTYLNEFRKNIFSQISLGYRNIFSKIAKKGGSSNWRECFFLTAPEMTKILDGEKIKIKDLVTERRATGIVVNTEGKIEFLKTEEVKKIKEYLEELHGKKTEGVSKETKTFKGFTANKGKITGTARVILNSADFHKISQGEILVTTMTSVDFVPIMDKAGAFVTNEGGITSHAAIVSREMNKPCIIGTQIATQVIKDGNLIEVDADHGVVRILEKNKHLVDEFLEKAHLEKMWPPITSSCIFVQSCTTWYKKYFDKVYNNRTNLDTLMLNDKGKNWLYVDSMKLEKLAEEVCEDYFVGGNKLNKLFSDFEKSRDNIVLLYSKLNYAEIKSMHETEFLNLAYDMADNFVITDTRACLSHCFDKPMLDKILKKHGIKEEITDDLFAKCQEIPHQSFDKQQEVEYLGHIIDGFPHDEIIEKMQYAFSSYSTIKNPQEIKDIFYEKFKDCDKEEAKTRLVEIQKEDTEKKEKYNKWYVTLENDIQRKVADFIYKVIEIRDVRKNPMSMSYTALFRVLEELFERNSLDKDYLLYVTFDELFKGSDYLVKNFDTIKNRDNGCVLLIGYIEGGVKIEYGMDVFEDAQEKMNKIYLKEEIVTELKGACGSSGKIAGKVRVIQFADRQRGEFKQGEVLVTGMTRPEFVPLMKKAVAVITDEGGITCHAAIISRELNIPCVIGTKFATQVLKDGDLVEVDADKGIVKILKKN